MTQVQLAEAAQATQRVVSSAKAPDVTTDELPGLQVPGAALVEENAGARRERKRFRMIATLPQRGERHGC